jgi:hypothetical protein
LGVLKNGNSLAMEKSRDWDFPSVFLPAFKAIANL